jgi:hypothetical protein
MIDTTNVFNKLESNQIVDTVKYIDTMNVNFIATQDLWFYYDKLTPLIFLILGILIGYGLDKWKENRNFKKSRVYFFHSLFLIKESLGKQIDFFEDNVAEIKEESDQLPLLNIDSGLNTDNLQSIGKEVIFKIMIKEHEKDDEYLNRFDFILKSFSLIKGIEEACRLQEQNLFNANNRILTNIDVKLKEIRETNNNLLTEFGKPKGEKISQDLINEIADLNDESQVKKGDKHSIFRDMEDFILPLEKIVKKYHYVRLMVYVSDVKHLFNELVKCRKSFTDKIEFDVEHFKNIVHDITATLYIYRKYLDKDVRNRLFSEDTNK